MPSTRRANFWSAEAAVRDDHDQVRVLLRADVGDRIARFLLPEPELPVAARAEDRRGERGPGIGETDDGHLQPAHLLDHVLRERRLVPLAVRHVVGDDRELRHVDEVEEVLLVVDELPVGGGHRVIADGVHDLHHRDAPVEHRQPRPVPRVAGIEHQGPPRLFRAQTPDDGGHVGHAPEPALQRRLGDVVALAGLSAPWLDLVEVAVVDVSRRWLHARASTRQPGTDADARSLSISGARNGLWVRISSKLRPFSS